MPLHKLTTKGIATLIKMVMPGCIATAGIEPPNHSRQARRHRRQLHFQVRTLRPCSRYGPRRLPECLARRRGWPRPRRARRSPLAMIRSPRAMRPAKGPASKPPIPLPLPPRRKNTSPPTARRGPQAAPGVDEQLEGARFPALGSLAVRDIDTPQVLEVLDRRGRSSASPPVAFAAASRPSWTARAGGFRENQNPARWQGI